VTGESEAQLGGKKWGCWHSLLEIKEGGQVAGQYEMGLLAFVARNQRGGTSGRAIRFLLSLSLSLSDGLVLPGDV